ncbi:hypothetical protein Tco_0619994 [Tanacetum coccineum]
MITIFRTSLYQDYRKFVPLFLHNAYILNHKTYLCRSSDPCAHQGSRIPPDRNLHNSQSSLIVLIARVAKLEKDVSELKTIDHSTKYLAILKSQVPSVINNYLGSKVGYVFQKELKKHTTYLIQKYSLQQFFESFKKQTPTFDLEQGSEKSALEILQIKTEQAEKQQKPKFTIKSTDKATLEKYDLKSALYQSMHANKSFNKNPANHRLYHALMEVLIEDENVMDKGVADTVKDHKRKHDDDEDPPAGPNQGKNTKRRRTKESESSKKPTSTKETPKGKAPTKGSKTGKSASAKELVEEPIAEVVMDDVGDDVVYKLDWNNPEGDRYPFDLSNPQVSKFSKHNVYSTKAILGVKSVSVKKLHGYGHLEEIVVKRSDQ